MSENLKPCPFCGGTEIDTHGDDKVVGYHCLTCEAVGPNQYITYPEPREWNTRADLAKPRVKPLVWHDWGGEWDANNPIGGTFTVKICGNSGYYLFTSESNKATDFCEVVKDRSTPDDCMKQAQVIVERRVLGALE